MTKKFVAVLLGIALMGQGCFGPGQANPKPYVPGEIPTDEQLRTMTDEEKREGMEAMMESHQPETITREEQIGETNKSIMFMKEGTTIRHGTFEGRFLHPADGSVRVIEQDGGYKLVFSDAFSVLPGPALYVYLSSESSPQSAASVMDEGFEIAKLKTFDGVQTYELPSGINWGNEGVTSSRVAIHSVVIVCKPFKFIFASAGF